MRPGQCTAQLPRSGDGVTVTYLEKVQHDIVSHESSHLSRYLASEKKGEGVGVIERRARHVPLQPGWTTLYGRILRKLWHSSSCCECPRYSEEERSALLYSDHVVRSDHQHPIISFRG